MAYQRQRRTQAQHIPPEQLPYPVDSDGDRLYAEEDYALPMDEPLGWSPTPDESFVPDEGFVPDEAFAPDDPQSFDPFNIPQTLPELVAQDKYSSLNTVDDLDDDPLAEDLLTPEELAALRRSHWRMLAGLADFVGVLVGAAVILLLVMLLVSLVNWLLADIDQTFTLWQMRM